MRSCAAAATSSWNSMVSISFASQSSEAAMKYSAD
jgi:hypothetical protein